MGYISTAEALKDHLKKGETHRDIEQMAVQRGWGRPGQEQSSATARDVLRCLELQTDANLQWDDALSFLLTDVPCTDVAELLDHGLPQKELPERPRALLNLLHCGN